MKTNLQSTVEDQTASRATAGWLYGTVIGAEPSRHLLLLRARETGKKMPIRWVPETQFAVDGRPGSRAVLCVGPRVRLHCRFAQHELQADNISIGRFAQPGTEPTKVMPLHPEPPQGRGRDDAGNQSPLTP